MTEKETLNNCWISEKKYTNVMTHISRTSSLNNTFFHRKHWKYIYISGICNTYKGEQTHPYTDGLSLHVPVSIIFGRVTARGRSFQGFKSFHPLRLHAACAGARHFPLPTFYSRPFAGGEQFFLLDEKKNCR